MTTLSLTKHHGHGNDFVVLLDLDGAHPLTAALARALCDRHRGIGADGMIRAQAALAAGLVTPGEAFVVLTPGGPRAVTVCPTEAPGVVWASVEMGTPEVAPSDAPDRLRVNVGNPHLVILGPDPASVSVAILGSALDSQEPGGLNVEWVRLGPGPDEATMRVWERGVGETLACGTGSCAVAVALRHWGHVGHLVFVNQPGGRAEVQLRQDGSVVLAGPSHHVAVIEVRPGELAA